MSDSQAYAVGHLDTTCTPPTVVAVRIYSDEAGSITTDQRKAFPFDIMRWYGDSYAECIAPLVQWLKQWQPWAFELLPDEHKARLPASHPIPTPEGV